MKKAILILLLSLFLFAIYSNDNYVGLTSHNSIGVQPGGTSRVYLNIDLGFSHNYIFKKYFLIENNILTGYTHCYVTSTIPSAYGFNIYHSFMFKFCFGNDKVKFSFSPFGVYEKFLCLFSINNDFNWIFYSQGLEITNVGLEIFIGKKQQIQFTPIYLNVDLEFMLAPLIGYIPNFYLSGGSSIRFKVIKK